MFTGSSVARGVPLIKFRYPDRLKGDEPSASGDEFYDKRASDI